MSETFRHPALFYRGDAEYLDALVPFVRDGLDAGDRVAVAVPGERGELLRSALGAADAARVRFTDMARAGRNPGRIIPSVLTAFCDDRAAASDAQRGVRIVGEPVWPGRTAVEYAACVQQEALINTAFEGRPITILCPYDASGLPAEALADAHVTHPAVIDGGAERSSPDYDPQRAIAAHDLAPAQPADAACFPFERERLRDARQFAVASAAALGLTGRLLDDLALAVAELTTNSVLYGGGSGVVGVWAEDGQVVCQVQDAGLLADPLAGCRVPPPGRPGGRGLLMVHQIADLVRVHSGADGTAVRLFLALPDHDPAATLAEAVTTPGLTPA
ncbi:sensor histidine kinase [Streptomyces sp. V4-01]|uniref:Sensor histidine kinase n=1 Tax=Actinacidiphila polyblastidii TaxID=3110430 RepID=A0ABU7PBV0_9ACTN|nr:sensor histidine kinase [Streptomyces sp. V4-01]